MAGHKAHMAAARNRFDATQPYIHICITIHKYLITLLQNIGVRQVTRRTWLQQENGLMQQRCHVAEVQRL
jgi:hypothetical protein